MHSLRCVVLTAIVVAATGCAQETPIDDRIIGQWLCQPNGDNGVSIGFAFKSDGDILVK